MGKVRVAGFGVSIDGFGAGPGQSLRTRSANGARTLSMVFPDPQFPRCMASREAKPAPRTNRAPSDGRLGAFILGRNMFGPAGDDRGGPNWKGLGRDPPYHMSTFVLTDHAGRGTVMEGGTTSISSPMGSRRRSPRPRPPQATWT